MTFFKTGIAIPHSILGACVAFRWLRHREHANVIRAQFMDPVDCLWRFNQNFFQWYVLVYCAVPV